MDLASLVSCFGSPACVITQVTSGLIIGMLLFLVAAGHDRADVERVIALVDRAEYKRRQAPPGVRLSTKAFGRDRRMPITNRYGTAVKRVGELSQPPAER